MLARFRKISLFMAYTVATIPLWHYITDANILLLMLAVLIFAYLNIVLSSVEVAQAILSSEKAKTPLPRWLPQKPKYEKWWLIVRHTLKWHLLLVPAKMGLALACTQWLFINFIPESLSFLSETYNYIAYGHYFDYVPYPATYILATIVMTTFSILESYLLVSIIFLISKLTNKTGKRYLLVLALKFMLSLSLASVCLLIRPLETPYLDLTWSPCPYANPYRQEGDELQRAYQDCTKRRITETIYTSLLTPLDQSILLTANIMRPLGQLTYGDVNLGASNARWDNRLFVLRQCVAGSLGIFLYLGTTWVILWFAEDEPHQLAS